MRQKKIETGRRKRSEFANGNGDEAHTEEKGLLCIWNFPLHKLNDNLHRKKFRTETHIIKQEGTEEKNHRISPK